MNRMMPTAIVAGAVTIAAVATYGFAHGDHSAYGGALCQAAGAAAQPVSDGLRTVPVTAGPWTATDATSVTLVCAVSVGDRVLDAADVAVEVTEIGSVATLQALLRYEVRPDLPTYLCSLARWRYPGGTTTATTPSCGPIGTLPTEEPSPTASPSASPPASSCPPGEVGTVVESERPPVGPVTVCVDPG
jgi:hypothetical protein